MAYTDSATFRERATSLGLAAGVQLALAAALVSGLAMTALVPRETRTDTFNVPAPTPTTPPHIRPHPNPTTTPQRDPFTPTPPIHIDGGTTIIPSLPQPTGDPLPPLPTATTADIPARPATPAGRPGDWVTAADYPGADIRAGHAGVVRFILGVGSDGHATSCLVTASSGWPGLDNATCARLMAHARVRPASDTTGAATPGSFAGQVRWIIPTGDD